jgi:hypothetical protein
MSAGNTSIYFMDQIIKMTQMDNELFPTGFMNIGNMKFSNVYKTKPIFVDFTIEDMINCTGFFLKWQGYCRTKRGLVK